MKRVSFRNAFQKPIPAVEKGMPSRAERRVFFRAFLNGYYPSGCEDIVDHDCDPCEPSEFGRVRSAFFIKQGFEFNDPTNTLEWQNAIRNKNVILIPFTNGEIPMPSPKTIPGYGDNLEQFINYEFTAKFNDPNFVSNTSFYNSIAGQRTWRLGWRTSTQCYITPVTVTIIPMYTVPDDLQTKLVWEVQMKWISNQFPVPFNIPESIFDTCFELA